MRWLVSGIPAISAGVNWAHENANSTARARAVEDPHRALHQVLAPPAPAVELAQCRRVRVGRADAQLSFASRISVVWALCRLIFILRLGLASLPVCGLRLAPQILFYSTARLVLLWHDRTLALACSAPNAYSANRHTHRCQHRRRTARYIFIGRTVSRRDLGPQESEEWHTLETLLLWP